MKLKFKTLSGTVNVKTEFSEEELCEMNKSKKYHTEILYAILQLLSNGKRNFNISIYGKKEKHNWKETYVKKIASIKNPYLKHYFSVFPRPAKQRCEAIDEILALNPSDDEIEYAFDSAIKRRNYNLAYVKAIITGERDKRKDIVTEKKEHEENNKQIWDKIKNYGK